MSFAGLLWKCSEVASISASLFPRLGLCVGHRLFLGLQCPHSTAHTGQRDGLALGPGLLGHLMVFPVVKIKICALSIVLSCVYHVSI